MSNIQEGMNTKPSPMPIIAAAILLLEAIISLSFPGFRGIHFIQVLSIAASIFLAVVLFMRRRDILLLIACGVFALITPFSRSDFSCLAAGILLLGFACCNVLKTYEKYAEQAKKLWFLPGALMALSSLLHGSLIFFNFFTWITYVLSAAAYFTCSLWIVYPNGMPIIQQTTAKRIPSTQQTTVNGTTIQEGDGYCDLVKHILLLLFTFGIWYFIWIYRITAYLNQVNDEPPRNPTNQLLLCIFIPFYLVYWVYKSAQRLDRLAKSRGVTSDLSTLCLILAIFVVIIPPILMQEKINTIATAKTNANVYDSSTHKAQQSQLGVAEELKKFKELLDNGIISQEEFDEKKKQLLGL
jgi:hypothetical protein